MNEKKLREIVESGDRDTLTSILFDDMFFKCLMHYLIMGIEVETYYDDVEEMFKRSIRQEATVSMNEKNLRLIEILKSNSYDAEFISTYSLVCKLIYMTNDIDYVMQAYSNLEIKNWDDFYREWFFYSIRAAFDFTGKLSPEPEQVKSKGSKVLSLKK